MSYRGRGIAVDADAIERSVGLLRQNFSHLLARYLISRKRRKDKDSIVGCNVLHSLKGHE